MNRQKYYKLIDKLPYSVKPKNYSRFRSNLTDCLTDYLEEDSDVTIHESLMEILLRKMFRKGIYNVPIRNLSEHAIMVLSLIENVTEGDDLEYDFKVPDRCSNEKYMSVISETIAELS